MRHAFSLLLNPLLRDDGWPRQNVTGRDRENITLSDTSLSPPGSLSHDLMRIVIWKIPPLTKEADVSLYQAYMQ